MVRFGLASLDSPAVRLAVLLIETFTRDLRWPAGPLVKRAAFDPVERPAEVRPQFNCKNSRLKGGPAVTIIQRCWFAKAGRRPP